MNQEPKSEPSTIASHKPADAHSYFWYLHGRIRTCFELIDAGRLNFACIEIDCNLIQESGFDRLGEIIVNDLMDRYYEVHFEMEAVAVRKIAYVLLASNRKRIEEAKEVFKVENPEEFYYRLKALEEGAPGNELSMIRREAERKVVVFVDKPMGSKHPRFGWTYPINCGYVRRACTIHGDTLSVYILGVDRPINIFSGKAIAVVYRRTETTYRLVVAPDGIDFSDNEIEKAIEFENEKHNRLILR
ncbi:MAG: hypothetical protein HZA14_13055 [Nitrospirae bacterium]|nr:hypothetical protein [Nitrospirota bacterium]